MVNGLGVLGWGVGGIEAEAAMLGQPLSMLLPPVVGLRISGEPRAGITATDVVLTVTELLRDHGVVGAFVECYGPGVAALPLETRATIGNMSPEYGATCTMFPIDQVTLDYLRFTGRDEEHLALVGAYAKAQGLWHDPGAPEPLYSEHASLDLGDVEPSLAGPSRPQDRVALAAAADSFLVALDRTPRGAPTEPAAAPHHQVTDGDVVIAAITSCTNTSNPQVLVGAGLVAKKAVERGPALQAVGEDVTRTRLPRGHRLPRARRSDRTPTGAGLLPRRLRLHDLHRKLGPAPRRRERSGEGG